MHSPAAASACGGHESFSENFGSPLGARVRTRANPSSSLGARKVTPDSKIADGSNKSQRQPVCDAATERTMEHIVVIRVQRDQANPDEIDCQDRSTREQAPTQLPHAARNADHLAHSNRSENRERDIMERGAALRDQEVSRPVG